MGCGSSNDELSLTRDGLLRVRDKALGASANATPFHPANAAGMLAYFEGVYALRDQFIGDEWAFHRSGAVEMIRNDRLRLNVGFSNVDLVCDDEHDPKARSRKGSDAERVCQYNLFPNLPRYAPKPGGEDATFYLMLARDGAAELSRPTVEGDNFGPCIERIYLSDGSDLDDELLPWTKETLRTISIRWLQGSNLGENCVQ